MSSRRRAFAGVVAVALGGQLATLAYEITVAGRFGTRREADALALALILTIAVGNEFTSWVSTLLVPNFVEVRSRLGAAAAARFSRRALAGLAIGAAIVAVVVAAAAPALVALLAPGVPDALGARLLRLFSPLIVLMAVAALLAAVLQASERFVAAGLRQLFWYGAALAAVVVLPQTLGPVAVPLGMVAGLGLFCAVLLAAGRRAARGPAEEAPLGPWFRRMAVALPPLALASAANYVNIAYERSLAARLPEGSLAALTYAFRLLNFPVTLLVLNATTLLFPPLALHAAERDTAALASLLRRALRLALVFSAPLAALALALAEPAIRVLLERGAFTHDSTRLTATALAWYAPSVIGIAGVQVLTRAYQALHAIRALVATGLAVIAANLAMMPTFTALLGLRGLPLSISVSALALLGLMLLVLQRRLPALQAGALLGWSLRPLAAAAAGGACAALVAAHVPEGLPALAAGGAAGLAAYGLGLLAVAPDDARLALGLVAPALARRLSESG
ncbi:MAG: hypothetical protein HY294_04720 [Candidatus Rokubacteria bacterium]|nr:hypothetical protein [Candidatus Rokubacteria bacterium]